ncbi:MAG: aspartate aminotransferase family protein [Planctomycetes bacterium]|nr:aspartate aminotransferase family protein [Planctomycetota bacterium]
MSDDALRRAYDLATEYLEHVGTRPVGARTSLESLRSSLAKPLPDDGVDPDRVIEELARDAEPGLVANAGPRYFGFVIGGGVPVAVAADWLTSAWNQCAGLYVVSPAASVVEEVAASWVCDLFGLPKSAGVAFVTGTQMASFTALAAARHAVLARAGWDVEARGLFGAPRVHVVLGEEAHTTIFKALRLLGLGSGDVVRVPVDRQGRMRAGALSDALRRLDGPTIVCAQVGNVNTGGIDPVGEIAEITRPRGAWLHVDGAFGLWAAASPALRGLVAGVERADSWVTDGHKWLNVPYDSGIVVIADRESHAAAMAVGASYLQRAESETRDGIDWGPELSRRCRGFAIYATLRSLGRRGVAELIESSCALARRFAERLVAVPSVEILNEVVLNQVLVRFAPPNGGDRDVFTREVISRVQAEGTCWLGGTTWQGREAMRISVSGWNTTESDVDRSAAAILDAASRRDR